MKKDTRLKPEVRKEQILTAALELAGESHYLKLTRDTIAEAVGLSGPAVQYHFKTVTQLRNAIIRAAVKREDLVVIAQGLGAKEPHAEKASAELQQRARAV